jgi:hypothetical protein
LKYVKEVAGDCHDEIITRDTYDILKGLEHISAQIAEMNTPQPDYTKLIEDCDHSRYWQSEVDGHKSMNKCIICGFQWSGKVIKR